MSGTATTIHNERVKLLATILNNAGLAFIVAAFIAPAPRPWLAYRHDPGLGRLRRGPTFQRTGRAREAAMTWDQAVTLLILPGIVALVLGLGGIWLARRIP